MHIDLTRLRDFALRYTAAWCSQNAESVAAFYSPEGSLTVNGDAPAVGRNAITAIAQSFMSAFPDMRIAMDDLLVQDDTPHYHWTLTGTNSGPGGTGCKVHISGFEIWHIGEDGLVTASQGHFDGEEYQRQLQGVQTSR